MKLPIAIAAGLLIGVTAGFFIGRSSSAPDSTAKKLPESTHEHTSNEPQRRSKPAAPSVNPRPAPAATGDASGVTLQQLEERAHAQLEEMAVSSTTGQIMGSVVDANGGGVVGVELVARAYIAGGHRGIRSPHDCDLEQYVSEAAFQYVSAVRLQRKTMTDAAGSYVLSNLPDNYQYSLTPQKAGYQFRRNGDLAPIEVGGQVEFVATQLSKLELVVKLPTGSRAERATVSFSSGMDFFSGGGDMMSAMPQPWSPENSSFFLRPGTYTCRAVLDDDYKSEPVPVTLGEGEEQTLTVSLQLRSGIRGTISYPPGESPSGSIAVRYIVAEGPRPTGEELLKQRQTSQATEGGFTFDLSAQGSSSNGESFQIFDLEPGRYYLGVGRSHSRIDYIGEVSVGRGMTQHDIALDPLPPGALLNVRMAGSDGEELDAIVATQFTLRIVDTAGRKHSSSCPAVLLDDGSYNLFLSEAQSEVLQQQPEARLEMQVRGWGAQSIDLAPNRYRYTLPLVEPAYLELKLDNSVAADDAVGVYLQPQDGVGNGVSGNVSRGLERLGPLAPGNYTLTARMRRSQQPYHVESLYLSSGVQQLTLQYPTLSSFAVRLPGRVPAAVTLRNADNGGVTRGRIEEGIVYFDDVPGGHYLLKVGSEYMSVQLPGRGEFEFQAEQFNALRVLDNDPSTVVKSLQLQPGDIIIGVAGEEFPDLNSITRMLMKLKRDQTNNLQIIRQGSRLTLEGDIPPGLLFDRSMLPCRR